MPIPYLKIPRASLSLGHASSGNVRAVSDNNLGKGSVCLSLSNIYKVSRRASQVYKSVSLAVEGR